MLAILSIHCSFLHYHGIDTMGLPYVEEQALQRFTKLTLQKKSTGVEGKVMASKASGVSYGSYLRLAELLTSPQRIRERSRRILI